METDAQETVNSLRLIGIVNQRETLMLEASQIYLRANHMIHFVKQSQLLLDLLVKQQQQHLQP